MQQSITGLPVLLVMSSQLIIAVSAWHTRLSVARHLLARLLLIQVMMSKDLKTHFGSKFMSDPKDRHFCMYANEFTIGESAEVFR